MSQDIPMIDYAAYDVRARAFRAQAMADGFSDFKTAFVAFAARMIRLPENLGARKPA